MDMVPRMGSECMGQIPPKCFYSLHGIKKALFWRAFVCYRYLLIVGVLVIKYKVAIVSIFLLDTDRRIMRSYW